VLKLSEKVALSNPQLRKAKSGIDVSNGKETSDKLVQALKALTPI
jgi:hypothetical protein